MPAMPGREPRAPRAFINYRAKDTLHVADALYRELKREIGEDSVFLDHRNLEPGEPYPANLETEVRSSAVVLSLIGPIWLTVQGEHGVRRLDEPDDWVRRELELALELGIPIMPVLIDGTPPLSKAAFRTIPKLEPLAEIQGLRLESRDWDAHFDRLGG